MHKHNKIDSKYNKNKCDYGGFLKVWIVCNNLISVCWPPMLELKDDTIGLSSILCKVSVSRGGARDNGWGFWSTLPGTAWLIFVNGPCFVSWWTLCTGSLCFFLWWIKLLLSGPVQLHLSHLYGCSPVCLLLWLIRLSDRLNFLPQKSQVWPNSALWTSWCFLRECFNLNVIPQSSQAKSRMLEWTLRWTW